MRKAFFAATLAALAIAGTAGAKGMKEAKLKEASTKDRQAVQKLSESYEQAFNAHDAKKLSSLFVEQGSANDPATGNVIEGRAAIEQSFRKDHQEAMKDAKLDLTIASVKQLTPDLLMVEVDGMLTGAADPKMGGESRAVSIVTRTNEGWKLAALRVFPTPSMQEQPGIGGAGMPEDIPEMEPPRPVPSDDSMNPEVQPRDEPTY